jgi:hypothetical protein
MLIISGAALIVSGFIFSGKLGPFGKLPGDITISRPGFTFYFPITTSILISIVITLIFWLLKK